MRVRDKSLRLKYVPPTCDADGRALVSTGFLSFGGTYGARAREINRDRWLSGRTVSRLTGLPVFLQIATCVGNLSIDRSSRKSTEARDTRYIVVTRHNKFIFDYIRIVRIKMKNRAKIEWWCPLVLGGFALFLHLGNIRLANGETTEAIGVTDDSGKGHVTEESRQHHCCARHEKMMDVGEGISGEVIRIDAGHCHRFCPHHVSDDPGDVSRPAVLKCPPNSHCHPRAARLERVSTLRGVKVVETVDTCDCSLELACRRESFRHHVHSGTPYQFAIDVGVCMGFCTKDLGCKPLKNRTISVNGPNGDEIYQAIEKCGCAGNCHRMDHTESVLDFSQIEIEDGSNTTDVRPIIRQINVGQCVGSCPGNEMETCLLRDKKEPRRCLAGLYLKHHTCTPASFKVHEYRTRRGAKREIIQIAECACV